MYILSPAADHECTREVHEIGTIVSHKGEAGPPPMESTHLQMGGLEGERLTPPEPQGYNLF